jgi:AcrR family transcriptional regulator
MKSRETKDLLIQKATDLFYEYGYTRAPIRKITEDLELQNTIIYYYFQSKDELLFAIIDAIADELIDNLEDIVEKVDDPLERLRQMLFNQILLIKTKKKEVKILVEDTDKLPRDLLGKILKKHRKIYDLYSYQLRRLQRAKRIKEIEFPVINFAIFGMINWSYQWFRKNGALSLEDVAGKIIQILFHGILTERE